MKKNRINHKVTVVLFLRKFYEAKNIDDFPNYICDYLQKNYLEVLIKLVATPGVDVFEVDKELTNFTKQRIIDNGVGSDLVRVDRNDGIIGKHSASDTNIGNKNSTKSEFIDTTLSLSYRQISGSAGSPIDTDDSVVSNYNLLPYDVNADYAQQRATHKKSLITAAVFTELVP
ncbi:hypothetical protein HCN44_011484 [Aphidius gifuensis]|uniref:Vacuolar membrane-associated protein Iml1 N-terminal domain-containing protein n=1 Tax=Aphidius gifuensis TaxID=684658 RepID=A0A834XP81_APHGI|nr:hypothetical protein HCN44_011484 [Aphidius gifuensis]